MKPHTMRKHRIASLAVIPVLGLGLLSGCVYFNTFYHAKKHFASAERQRIGGHGGTAGRPSRGGRFSQGNRFYLDAVEKCSKIIEQHPNSKWVDDALFMMGVCYYRVGEYTKSESALRELIASHPDSKFIDDGQLFLARCRLQLRREREAFELFDELIANADNKKLRAAALYSRGEILYDRGAYDSAFADFVVIREEYRDAEDAPAAMLLMGDGERRRGNFDESITAFRWVLDRTDDIPTRFTAQSGIGRSFYENGQPDSGIVVFRGLAADEEYDDSLAVVRLLWGQGLEAVESYDAAFEQYELVAEDKPNTAQAAEAYYRMGQIVKTVDQDLFRAKELFDAANQQRRNSEYGILALTQSANIAKLEKFRIALNRGEWLGSGSHRGGMRYEGGRYRTAAEALPDHAELAYALVHYTPGGYEAAVARLEAMPIPTVEAVVAEASEPLSDMAMDTPPNPADGGELASIGPLPVDDTVTDDSLFIGPPANAGGETGGLHDASIPREGLHYVVPSAVQVAQQREDSLRAAEADSLIRQHLGLYGPPATDSAMQLWIYADPEVNRLRRRLRNLYGPPRAEDIIQWKLLLPGEDPDAELTPAERAARDSARALAEQIRADSVSEAQAHTALIAAINTQFELAELYWFDLGLPDSALVEYELIADRAPEPIQAARALLAGGQLVEETLADSARAAEYYRRIVTDYSATDYAEAAIGRLGGKAMAASTEYPSALFAAAEHALLDDEDPSYAIDLYESLVQRYPGSVLAPRAAFAAVAVRELFLPPEDSSIVLAYRELVKQYPGTEYADAARLKLNPPKPKKPKPKQRPKTDAEIDPLQREIDSLRAEAQDTLVAPALPKAPRPKQAGQFVYPESQVLNPWRGKLVYSIWIDFTGEVSEYTLLNSSGVEDIDEAGRVAVEGTIFDPDSIPAESLNMEYLYEIRVTPPASEFDEFDRLGIDDRDLPDDHEARDDNRDRR